VNLKFISGNCYGLIGANGAGKSTFLKILSREIEPQKGSVTIGKNERIAILEQDQFKYDEFEVLATVIMGHKRLYEIIIEKDALYSKENFTNEDGMKAGYLEVELADLNGWDAETEAASLLSGLGISEELHTKKMKELDGGLKVRVLLAQAIFGNPDILLLDEPTNHLDLESVIWLENFLYKFENTVIVVSHDRHFINKVCTHIADIDFHQIRLFVGNYDFWYEASQLAVKQMKNLNRKKEDKIKDLKAFIDRFSSNASKAKQATSRKKQLEKLTLDEIPVSSRKVPFISFKADRQCGNVILEIENLSKSIDGVEVIKDFSLTVNKGDKIAFVGSDNIFKTTLFQILNENIEPDSGTFRWGQTISNSYFPKDNSEFFDNDLILTEWLNQYTDNNDESYIRGFLGRMLFTGEDALKQANVLSGGEKARCMLSKIMMSNSNVIILDEPTSHIDLETISVLNNSLISYNEILLFSSHDHQFISTIANRIIEIT
ncbi:MAG: ATP-binding cassette domain-containing protein, partial [Candidatus Cloacimonetes bacterium]|nr:ATP-binding cassette domain-containing protein [Candidatus Cloacimonadota bacterium]